MLLDTAIQPSWISDAIEQVQTSSFAQVTHVLYSTHALNGHRGAPAVRSLALRGLLHADRWMFRRSPDPLIKTSILPLMSDATRVSLSTDERLLQATLTSLREADLDVILCLGAINTGNVLADVARHGVWYFPEWEERVRRGVPIGFAETASGRPVVETSLNRVSSDGYSSNVLCRSVSAANAYSPHYTERRILWSMANFPARALKNLATAGLQDDMKTEDGQLRSVINPRPPALPDNLATMGIATRLATRLLSYAGRAAFSRTEWSLAVGRDASIGLDVVERGIPEGAFVPVKNPPDRFWADPFPVTDGTRQWLFVEEFPHSASRAHLAVMAIDSDGRLGPSVPILYCPYHLSYPFVFQWNGDWYLIPESGENLSVDLYRSVRFPYEWVHERRLVVGVRAVDTTLAEIDGRWWMFTTIAPRGGSENDELHIFHAASPLGPWTPLPANPQISDVRRARSAGRVFQYDGSWFRPAQDCSRRYGYAMNINRITELSANTYAEEPIARIDPTWAKGLLGTHTFNHDGGPAVIDGERRRWTLPLGARH